MSETPETPDEGPVPEDVGPDLGQTGKCGRKARGRLRMCPGGSPLFRSGAPFTLWAGRVLHADHAGDVLYVGMPEPKAASRTMRIRRSCPTASSVWCRRRTPWRW